MQTYDKVYKTDNQLLLEYVMYGRFANAHINKTFRTPSFDLKSFTEKYEEITKQMVLLYISVAM